MQHKLKNLPGCLFIRTFFTEEFLYPLTYVKVIPGEAGFRTDCFKICVYNTKDIILLTSIVVSCPSGIC